MGRIHYDITYTLQRQILNIHLAYTVLGPILEKNLPIFKVFLEILYLEGYKDKLLFFKHLKNIVRF